MSSSSYADTAIANRSKRDAGRAKRSCFWWCRTILLAAFCLFLALVLASLIMTFVKGLRYAVEVPKVDRVMTVEEYEPNFRTGDLILTCDLGDAEQKNENIFRTETIIKAFTQSWFHHSGIVYVDPKTRQVFVCDLNGKGTRLATLRDLFRKKNIMVVVVPRIGPPVDTFAFERAIEDLWGSRLDTSIIGNSLQRFLRVPGTDLRLLPSLASTAPPKGESACVTMTSLIYHELGVLDLVSLAKNSKLKPWHLYPRDYILASASRTPGEKHKQKESPLPLTQNYAFGEMIQLKEK